jgi:hypothetical protein
LVISSQKTKYREDSALAASNQLKRIFSWSPQS